MHVITAKPHTGIIINLDYEHQPSNLCNMLWDEIQAGMLAKGFKFDGRIFTIDLDQETARHLAQSAIESIEDHLDYHERRMHKYIKDFYGFSYSNITNMLTPPPEQIEVTYLENT